MSAETDVTEDVIHDAVHSIMEEREVRLTRECLGAWRAGYDYLVECVPVSTHEYRPDPSTWKLKTVYLPMTSPPEPGMFSGGYHVRCHELTPLDDPRKRKYFHEALGRPSSVTPS